MLMGERTDLVEYRAAVRRHSRADNGGHLLMKAVHPRIGVGPSICQRALIESADEATDVLELEQPGPFGDQQSNRKLNRRDMPDQIEVREDIEEIAITFEAQPRMKGDERGRDRQPRRTAQRHGVEEIAAGMPLLEQSQDTIVDRFDGSRHEQAAGFAQARSSSRCPSRCSTLIVTS